MGKVDTSYHRISQDVITRVDTKTTSIYFNSPSYIGLPKEAKQGALLISVIPPNNFCLV